VSPRQWLGISPANWCIFSDTPRTRQTAPYTDVTVSFSKSISVLHASIRENARRGRQAGDEERAAWWDGREREFQEVLQAANRAALAHAETWAGLTRTGNHARRVDGQETGRFEQADLVGLAGPRRGQDECVFLDRQPDPAEVMRAAQQHAMLTRVAHPPPC